MYNVSHLTRPTFFSIKYMALCPTNGQLFGPSWTKVWSIYSTIQSSAKLASRNKEVGNRSIKSKKYFWNHSCMQDIYLYTALLKGTLYSHPLYRAGIITPIWYTRTKSKHISILHLVMFELVYDASSDFKQGKIRHFNEKVKLRVSFSCMGKDAITHSCY